MSLPKRLVGFLLRFLLFMVLLVAPWPGLAEGYATAFRWGANKVFSSFGSDGATRFLSLHDITPGDLPPGVEPPPATDVLDTLIEMRSRNDPTQLGYMRTASWQVGYRPTAFLIALILATPIPWRRRARALAWGLLWINAFVALRVALTLVMGFSGGGPVTLFSPGPLAGSILEFFSNMVVLEFEGDLVFPGAIWFLVSFRRSDFATFFRQKAAGGDPPVDPQ